MQTCHPPRDETPTATYLRRAILQVPTPVYVIALALVGLWLGHFALRVHGTYEKLAYDYNEAKKKVDVSKQHNVGHNVRIAFGKELSSAEELLSRSRFWRAWHEEWHHSYVCGNRSCWSLVFGERDVGTVFFYLAMTSLTAVFIKAFVTQSICFVLPAASNDPLSKEGPYYD